MKQKIIYSLVLICFIGLLSSANQNMANCKNEAHWLAAKSASTLNCPKEVRAETPVPLNLFLFDL
jgi:hypothetical protein